MCGNTYVNENLNQAKVSNRYEKLQFLLIIFPVFMSTKLPIHVRLTKFLGPAATSSGTEVRTILAQVQPEHGMYRLKLRPLPYSYSRSELLWRMS